MFLSLKGKVRLRSAISYDKIMQTVSVNLNKPPGIWKSESNDTTQWKESET